MARLRAVVTIHAPGLGGRPSDGHLAAATVNASSTASSAASISPRKRIRVATQRPYSRRKTASIVTARESMVTAPIRSLRVGRVGPYRVIEVPVEERADLDRPLLRDRGELGPLQGLVQVAGVDDPEPGEVFLGFGVRPVGNQEVSAGLAHHGRRLRRDQAALEHERTGFRQPVAQRVYVGPHLPRLFQGTALVIGPVEREQVLRHDDHSRLAPGAGLRPTLTPATKWPPPNRHPPATMPENFAPAGSWVAKPIACDATAPAGLPRGWLAVSRWWRDCRFQAWRFLSAVCGTPRGPLQ